MWKAATKKIDVSGKHGGRASLGQVVIVRGFTLLDIPISLVTDTLYFPFDYAAMPAPVDVKVYSDNRAPVVGAHVEAWQRNRKLRKGVTGKDGLFRWKGNYHLFKSIKVTKDGYYDTGFEINPCQAMESGVISTNMEMSVLLCEVRNPIPMYAYRLDTQLQDPKKPKGFDLLKNDWVAPWGKGENR